MYFCNNVDDYLAVDKIRMFRPNKLSIVPCEATRTRAWAGDPRTQTRGFLPSPFPQNVRGFMENLGTVKRIICSNRIRGIRKSKSCSSLYNCPRIAAARTPASWGQLVGDIFLIYIFVSKFSVCPSQGLVSVRSVSWLSPVPGWGCAPSTRNMFDNIQTNTKSTIQLYAKLSAHLILTAVKKTSFNLNFSPRLSTEVSAHCFPSGDVAAASCCWVPRGRGRAADKVNGIKLISPC